MDKSTFTPLPIEDLTDDVLADSAVFGPNQLQLGIFSRLYGADIAGYAVIRLLQDAQLASHLVAVPMREIAFDRSSTGKIFGFTEWTHEELRLLPDFADPANA